MSRSKFVSDAEYQVILTKVNQVICQFSKSTDKSSDAIVFMTRIEEKCTSRDEFLNVIEKRLDLLSNPNKSQEYIEWFKSKRSSLVTLLQNIKEKLTADPGYLSKYSPSFAKGMQCLDKLLKMNVEEIGHNQMVDLTRIQKAMYELKGGVNQKAKSPEKKKAPADPTLLYVSLLEMVSIMNALALSSHEDMRNTLYGKLSELKTVLEEHLSTYGNSLSSDAHSRLSSSINLLTEVCKHSPIRSEDDPSMLPLPLLYAVMCDLKAVEWRHLQELPTNSDNANAQEVLQQVQKRRKTTVSVPPVLPATTTSTNSSSSTASTLSPADQKLLDSMQQNQLELSTISDRVEHFLADMVRNDESFDLFEWDALLDINTYAGGALVIS